MTSTLSLTVSAAIVMLATTSVAIGQNWEWYGSGGGQAELDGARAVAHDLEGNIYATGYFSSAATFGPTHLDSRGGTDVFVVCYAPDGTQRWCHRAGSARDDFGMAITVSADGGVYVAGITADSADFGDSTITARNPGSYVLFLVRYRTNGAIDWTRKVDASGSINGVAVNTNGFIAITGYATGLARFSDSIGFITSATSIFTALYRPNGEVDWVREISSTTITGGIREGRGVAIDDDNNVFVTGYIANGTRFDDSTIFYAEGIANIFVARYDGEGRFQWVWRAGGPNYDMGNGIALDGNGDLYVAGYFQGPVVFAPGDTLHNPNYLGDVFVARFGGDGTLRWARSAGGSGNDEAKDIELTATGEIVVGGIFTDMAVFGSNQAIGAGGTDIFIARYSTNGACLGVITAGGPADDFGYGVTGGAGVGGTVAGSFQGDVPFGSGTAHSQGGTDAVVAQGGVTIGGVSSDPPTDQLTYRVAADELIIDNRGSDSRNVDLRIFDAAGRTLLVLHHVAPVGRSLVDLSAVSSGAVFVDASTAGGWRRVVPGIVAH